MKHQRTLLLFAKPPVAGRVKTRLIDQLGVAGATQVHQKLLYTTAATINQCDFFAPQLWVGFDPDHPVFKHQCFSHWQHQQQCDGDLGQRMSQAFSEQLRLYSSVLIVGSDCPVLSDQYIEQAFAALESDHQVVLGPAEDGGYVLVGMRQKVTELFRDIDWGSDRVLEQSRQRLHNAGASWFELEALWDVDRPEDVRRWQSDQ